MQLTAKRRCIEFGQDVTFHGYRPDKRMMAEIVDQARFASNMDEITRQVLGMQKLTAGVHSKPGRKGQASAQPFESYP